MQLFIDNKSGMPIYEQIVSQMREQIVDGRLQEDAVLPSIRQLARDLRISVITTKRAYDELERAGLIYTVAAKGCFVAPQNMELLREQNLRKIEEHMDAIGQLAVLCHLSSEELLTMMRTIMEENT